MEIRTIEEIPEINGKRIILRVDFNVPLEKNGDIADDNRIIQALPTINYLKEKGARLIIVTHMGRPKGIVQAHLRLNKVAERLSELLNEEIHKCDEVLSDHVKQDIANMQAGEIIMLENIRFRKEEEACDTEFTKAMAEHADIFVSDAFATAHRKHCSTAGLAEHLPAYAGFLMEKEIRALSKLLEQEPKRPLTMIFGGAKIDTKIGLIHNFIKKADNFLIGGGLANTFLYAQGHNVGDSLYQADKAEIAKQTMEDFKNEGKEISLPEDVVIAEEISEDAESSTVPASDVTDKKKILDIGPKAAEKFAQIIQESGTVIWNGPLGLYEMTPFQNGSKVITEAVEKCPGDTIIGGGDTVDCIKQFNADLKSFTHISTGGGACIEFLEGKKLPGIEILKK